MESRMGTGSQLKVGLKLTTALWLKTNVGSESESKVCLGSESKARPGLRLTSCDTKDERNHYMSILMELRILSTWASHLRERAEQRLPGQLVNNTSIN
ncbi:hypothetical protein EVAR_62954_1 [Eumeta japonica]|uniref:Uncharacterized protein n=1 Tax=Eumeta variegata TaxID=151549 RepID=A0A4C1ZIS4_EUMVA|nr:hypothetical protein EVAR_62954_1 [Eumeta japonica]